MNSRQQLPEVRLRGLPAEAAPHQDGARRCRGPGYRSGWRQNQGERVREGGLRAVVAAVSTARQRREARIAAAFDTIDRALKTHRNRSRWLSLAILVLGLIAVAAVVYLSPDARRRRAARALPLPSDSALVLRTLGPRPTRCPPGAMEHLEGELPVESIDADSVMLQLRRDTRQRWIYPGRHGCTPEKGETELGIDSAGRTLWMQPAAQRGEVRLSPRITW